MPILGKLLPALIACALTAPATAEPFEYIRIGDKDGFGFAATQSLVRATPPPHNRPADTNRDGVLARNEFLPDLNADGGVAWVSSDNFDNRSREEIANAANECAGCTTINTASSGSNWTDLSLSLSSPNVNWPDADGPAMPNNAAFVFDFKVAKSDIVEGSRLFFNLVFGDYDIDPALVGVRFRNQTSRTLALRNQGRLDGLIQARSTVLEFTDVFAADADGNWNGFLEVVFLAPRDPYTAFDYVELSLFDILSVQAPGQIVRS